MIVEALLGEFLYEAENTRKLLNAITDSSLTYKPSEKNWTTGQLGSHIAEVYNWYPGTLESNVFDMGTYKYDKGDITKAATIAAKFEENLAKAKASFERATDASMMETWSMVMGEKYWRPPLPGYK
jgi:uncharacterized damage-inducible protein DinB